MLPVVPGTGRVVADADLADAPRAIALAHAVARRPSDARVHVERVNHHLGADDAAGVYGALVDLFIAFDERAGALRRRMLLGSRHLLSGAQWSALEHAVDDGLHASDPLEPALWSVLSAGVCGAAIVERFVGDHDDDDDEVDGSNATAGTHDRSIGQRALDAARAAVRRGELSHAAVELQAAVVADPTNELVQSALVDLFRLVGEPQPVRELLGKLPADAPTRRWHLLIEELSL